MAYVGRPHTSLVGIDPGLDSISNLTTAADKMIYTTGADTYAVTPITAFGRSILDDADATTALSTLGVSTYAKTLLDDTDATTALSTLGVSTYVKTILDDTDADTVLSTLGVSAYAKTLLDDADAAATRTTLGLGTGATASAYVHPNHSGEVTSTADGATEIADNVVDEANLKVSNSPVNGYFLSAQSGNTGGLTWAEASGGGGGWTAVSTATLNASSSGASFTVSRGNFYLFTFEGLFDTNSASEDKFQAQFKNSSGTAQNTRWAYKFHTYNWGTEAISADTNTTVRLTHYDMPLAGGGHGVMGYMYYNQPSSTNSYNGVHSYIGMFTHGSMINSHEIIKGHGHQTGATEITTVTFLAGSETLTGKISCMRRT